MTTQPPSHSHDRDDIQGGVPSGGGNRPTTDPTELTDRAIAKAATAMRDYVDGQLSVRDERLRGIDEATKLRMGPVEAIPRDIQNAVGNLEKLMGEKFDANERLRVEQKKDTKDAVDAALNAAKEAVKEQTAASEKAINKSEESTGNQIAALRRELGDLKDREVEDVRTLRGEITSVATTANGTVQQRTGAKEDRTGLYAAIGIIGTIFGIAALVAGILAGSGGA